MLTVTPPPGWLDPPDDEPCIHCEQIDCICPICPVCNRIVDTCPVDCEGRP